MAKDTEKKYAVQVIATSDGEVLFDGKWPNQHYLDFVIAQAIIGKAFMEAGFERAKLEKGFEVPKEVLESFGIKVV